MINAMLLGAFIMASIIVGLFFFRFFKGTRDRFFLFFASSFLLEAVTRIITGTTNVPDGNPFIYLIRLFSYLLIIVAIIDKNRRYRKSLSSEP